MTREEAETKLSQIAAYAENWDSFGALPFTPEALDAGRQLVARCFDADHAPYRVLAGEGIMVYWRGIGRRSAHIEACPDGEILAVTSTGGDDGVTVWLVTDFNDAIGRIKAFLTAR